MFANEGGYEKNGSKYDAEIVGGQGLHIAIVKEPRYEGTMILLNARRIIKNSKDKKNLLDNNHSVSTVDVVIDTSYMNEIKNVLSNAKKIFFKSLKNEIEKEVEKEEEATKNFNIKNKNFYIKNEDGTSISAEEIENTLSEHFTPKKEVENEKPEEKEEVEKEEPQETTTEKETEEKTDDNGNEIKDEEDYEVLFNMYGVDVNAKMKGSDIKNVYKQISNRSYEEIQKDEDKLEKMEKDVEKEGEKIETEERKEVEKMQNSKNTKQPSAIQKSINNFMKNNINRFHSTAVAKLRNQIEEEGYITKDKQGQAFGFIARNNDKQALIKTNSHLEFMLYVLSHHY